MKRVVLALHALLWTLVGLLAYEPLGHLATTHEYRLWGAQQVLDQPFAVAGYELAAECLGAAPVAFERIRFYVVPGGALKQLDGNQAVFALAIPDRREVYVSEMVKDLEWVWGHEIVHVFGLKGHPAKFFDRCGLAP